MFIKRIEFYDDGRIKSIEFYEGTLLQDAMEYIAKAELNGGFPTAVRDSVLRVAAEKRDTKDSE